MKVFACFIAVLTGLTAGFAESPFKAESPAFNDVIGEATQLDKLAGDMQFVEGPVWLNRDDGFLVFSDIPANSLMSWSEKEGLNVFRKPSGKANGNTLDLQGRLVSAEHGGRRISITRHNGEVITIADNYGGKKFNSPNDVVVKSDGTVWFTDPDYGLEGRERELDKNYVFKFDPLTRVLAIVADDFDRPNGLCFSPDEKRLYVADSGSPRHIRMFSVSEENSLSDAGVFCKINPGAPDGIRVDAEGRLYSTAGDGIHVFAPSGELLGKILVPETPANLCFGGPENRTLFITARTSLYSIALAAEGK
ncbi:MAG: SMP-30/gluconolactonase/LRE family protein [Verrucomicrobia bacterium]|nr:SMP-30/gluconolactonase/LRE family protein [Verrucomicrobiota bacterium]MCF7709052.1 SMP-30/gluconolactonase/LRE family protein [Verrucomicrobiota bacterium]